MTITSNEASTEPNIDFVEKGAVTPSSPSNSIDSRPLVVAICMASAVSICSLLLVFGVCLLDSITSYEFGSIQTIVLATVLAMMNILIAWLFVATAGVPRAPRDSE